MSPASMAGLSRTYGRGDSVCPRYPSPKSPPSGRGLGGRSRRSPAGSVAPLRKVLRFSVSAVLRPCFTVILQGWHHPFCNDLCIKQLQNSGFQISSFFKGPGTPSIL
jgi:hypothetical protein